MAMKHTALKLSPKPWVCQTCAKAVRRQARGFATAASRRAELFDVVCVGGGPAGLSLLTALKSSPITRDLKVALVDSQDISANSSWSLPNDQYSNRASSLTPASRGFLESIGAWGEIEDARVQPYSGMQVWDGVSGSRIEFDWQPDRGNSDITVAYMVENLNLVRGLLRRLSHLEGVTLLPKSKIEGISIGPRQTDQASSSAPSGWPHISLSDNRTLAARLLVGADGFNSPVRSFAGIHSSGWDYNRHGVVATVKYQEQPERPVAYQRFLPTGPIALLPLPGPYATLVWSTLPEHAALLKTLKPKDFIAMVNAAFRLMPVDIAYMHTTTEDQDQELSWRLQHTPQLPEGRRIPYTVDAVQDGSIASFPLRFRHADTYATHRVALVGDAAHSVHPLAGQGLNMGIGDVTSLIKCIQDSVTHGLDIGDQLGLENYNAERYEPNHRLMGVVDKLHKLYSYSSGPVVGLRSWGLEAVNAMAPVKEFLMRQASGNA